MPTHGGWQAMSWLRLQHLDFFSARDDSYCRGSAASEPRPKEAVSSPFIC
jgi:hypothetical protein